jgi:hypothetical protein
VLSSRKTGFMCDESIIIWLVFLLGNRLAADITDGMGKRKHNVLIRAILR